MKILAIETSCDETAITIIEGSGDKDRAQFLVLGNALFSQIELHRPYGGVFPTLAKREHAKNIIPLIHTVLRDAGLLQKTKRVLSQEDRKKIETVCTHEEGLAPRLQKFLEEIRQPDIDVISVTSGPGLSPALWVGVNVARVLATIWNIKLVEANHMEGHLLSSLAEKTGENKLTINKVEFPVLALLISGGHTELICMRSWLSYERIGQTRDDAVGEAFDKVARLIGLPYPGGPEISKLAEQLHKIVQTKQKTKRVSSTSIFELPRPMINDVTYDFSFSGLKTAVRYILQKYINLSDNEKKHLAYEFECAVADVLISKTKRALEKTDARTLVLGGGVSANKHIQQMFIKMCTDEYKYVSLHIPQLSLSTDNAIMIAIAGFYKAQRKLFTDPSMLVAKSNASITTDI